MLLAAVLLWGGRVGWVFWEELQPSGPFEMEIMAFEQRDLTNPPPDEAVLFVGSSSIKLWDSIRRDLPRYRVFRRGFGGAQMKDVLAYAHRVILPYEAEMVVVHAGGNDVAAGVDPAEVLRDFKELAEIIHKARPKMRIGFLSLKPSPARWSVRDKLREVNDLIKRHSETDERFIYIDIYEKMLCPRGGARPEIFVEDGLHLNAEGYRIWADAVRPHLPKTARRRLDEALDASTNRHPEPQVTRN